MPDVFKKPMAAHCLLLDEVSNLTVETQFYKADTGYRIALRIPFLSRYLPLFILIPFYPFRYLSSRFASLAIPGGEIFPCKGTAVGQTPNIAVLMANELNGSLPQIGDLGIP